MLDPAGPQADGAGDRHTRARSVCDHDEPVEAEEVTAAVRLRVEALTKPPCTRSDEQTTEPPGERRAELRAERVEEGLDRSLERLQRDVPRESVRDDDVRPSLEEQSPLHVPGEPEICRAQELVRVDRQLVS